MEAKKENRGGARPGAGRKPSPVKRVGVSIYLTPAQREALDYLRSRAVDTSEILGRELLRLAEIHRAAQE